MTADKLKQLFAAIGGFLGAIYLFLMSVGVEIGWYNPDSIDAFRAVLNAAVPLILVAYGIWKNQYLVSPKAKEQEEVLKQKGLK